jgi:hypothetical protein
VQKALNHGDIRSTLRYAHVLDEEVAAGIERVAKSRKKSQPKFRKVIQCRKTRTLLELASEFPQPRGKLSYPSGAGLV